MAEPRAAATGFTILLDGKPLQLAGLPLTVPFRPLANAIAVEWTTIGAAGGDFNPADLPLTRLAGAAADLATSGRDALISRLAAYGVNDLLCYRADAPGKLVSLQAASWDPWVTWMNHTFAVPLITTIGVAPVQQPPGTKAELHRIIAMHDDHTLAALAVIVPVLGSLVLGLALAEQVLDAPAAMQTAFLDELYQEQSWGADPAAILRREKILGDIAAAARFMVLCSP